MQDLGPSLFPLSPRLLSAPCPPRPHSWRCSADHRARWQHLGAAKCTFRGPRPPRFRRPGPPCIQQGQGCGVCHLVSLEGLIRCLVQLLWIVSCLNILLFPEGSNTDRPDASAVYLHDFQRFLLHEQQVRGALGWGGGAEPPGPLSPLLPTCHLACDCLKHGGSLSSATLVSQTLEREQSRLGPFPRHKLRKGRARALQGRGPLCPHPHIWLRLLLLAGRTCPFPRSLPWLMGRWDQPYPLGDKTA